MAILAKSLLTLVRCDLMSFSFTTAGHTLPRSKKWDWSEFGQTRKIRLFLKTVQRVGRVLVLNRIERTSTFDP